jgi:hypothetical protein
MINKCSNKYVAFYEDTTFPVPILSPKHVLFIIRFVLLLLILKKPNDVRGS